MTCKWCSRRAERIEETFKCPECGKEYVFNPETGEDNPEPVTRDENVDEEETGDKAVQQKQDPEEEGEDQTTIFENGSINEDFARG